MEKFEIDFLEKHKNSKLILDAFYFAKKAHENQYRKGLDTQGLKKPYFTHCVGVANLLVSIGITDEISISTALVHDSQEDNSKVNSLNLIEDINFEVARNVFFLSRNSLCLDDLRNFRDFLPNKPKICSSELKKNAKQVYKLRFLSQKDILNAHLVKIADNCHNSNDLYNLRRESIVNKLNDAFQLYIPYGRIISPKLADILEENINKFLDSEPEFRKYEIDYRYTKNNKIEFLFEYLSKLQSKSFEFK